MSNPDTASTALAELAAAIVQTYVQTHAVSPAELPPLLAAVGEALRTVRDGAPPSEAPVPPRLPIPKTVTRDHIISLENGRAYRSLKRHLASCGLTPTEYRAKWGLEATYPLVAPSFSAQRARQARARERAKRNRAPGDSHDQV
jgi:predicted transcriptional regulator